MAEEAGREDGKEDPSSTSLSEEVPWSSTWPVPVLDLSFPPQRLYHFHHQFKLDSLPHTNFPKAAKWAPDGSCFATSTDDGSLRVFDMPDLNSTCSPNQVSSLADDSFMSRLTIPEGESIYDYCWYPNMHSSDRASCVVAVTARDHPVHLWDSLSGELRCTYRAYDAMDEIATAFSIASNLSGSKLYCGYKKVIRVFDIHRPGRDFIQFSTTAGAKDGQTGIISCLAFSHSCNGLFAAGSYDRTTALYDEANAELLYVLHGQEGGVTQALFSKDGSYLYTGGRKDPYILCWDLRNTSGILFKLYRSAQKTNQRIAFDIDPYGQYIGSGGEDGCVNIYNTQSGEWAANFQASYDIVNGICFHPYYPIAVSSSGQRRFNLADDGKEKTDLTAEENCVSIWSFSCSWTQECISCKGTEDGGADENQSCNDINSEKTEDDQL